MTVICFNPCKYPRSRLNSVTAASAGARLLMANSRLRFPSKSAIPGAKRNMVKLANPITGPTRSDMIMKKVQPCDGLFAVAKANVVGRPPASIRANP
ncbi:hypothetical protein D3C71_1648280 [compost metagenome]